MQNVQEVNQTRGGFKVPHTLVIIVSIILLVAVATYIVPGGAYERVVNEAGRTVVLDGSFSYIASEPQGLFAILQAPINGIVAAAEIISFLFIVSGSFNIITRTKAIDSGIARAVHVFKGKEILIIPIMMTLFSLGGATFGMVEETIPFIAMLVPLSLALGYDSIVGVAICYLAANTGFSSAMLNPFTVGIAQSIAEIPVFSGFEYRTIIWVITTIVTILFMMIYANKIKKNPQLSPMYKYDQLRRVQLSQTEAINTPFTTNHKIILSLVLLCLGIIVYGVLVKGFWIPQIAAVFFATGIIAGLLARLNVNDMADAFIEGAKAMIGAAIMVGFARAIVMIAENAQIIDTLLFHLSNVIGQLPTLVAGYVMLIVQMVINFFVGSGSGQAALTMPILAPLSDLIDISRQSTVLIYQFGDGFSNAMFPTSGTLIACLGIAGVPFTKWLKWIIPLQLILFILAILFITPAILLHW